MKSSINIGRLRDVSLGDDEFLGTLIEMYLSDSSMQLTALQQAIASGDERSASAAAHRLKGSSGNMGANRLADLCAQIEALGRKARLADCADALNDLRQEFRRVQEELGDIGSKGQ